MLSNSLLLEIKSPDKLGAIQEASDYFTSKGYKIIYMEVLRPWGFFFYFDTAQTKQFADEFFDDVELVGIDTNLPLQPKVLVFAPGQRLSWQYHNRRSEIWRVITNAVTALMSPTDKEPPAKILKYGDVINFTAGSRHRGGAPADSWGAVAEIWQHTDPQHLSDEADVVRIQDDYGRH